jgi:hypothetical protein
VTTDGLRAEIRIRDLTTTKQECCTLDRDAGVGKMTSNLVRQMSCTTTKTQEKLPKPYITEYRSPGWYVTLLTAIIATVTLLALL